MDKIREIKLERFEEPFSHKWKIQTINKKKDGTTGVAVCVAYIDARDVHRRLDEVVGKMGWQTEYISLPMGDGSSQVICRLGILDRDTGQWIWKSDTGAETSFEKEKGRVSDSLKRAAVQWGIGRYLYDLKVVKVGCLIEPTTNKLLPYDKANRRHLWDSDALSEYIERQYGTAQAAPYKGKEQESVPGIQTEEQQNDQQEPSDLFLM